jgi:hypothetical protein
MKLEVLSASKHCFSSLLLVDLIVLSFLLSVYTKPSEQCARPLSSNVKIVSWSLHGVYSVMCDTDNFFSVKSVRNNVK